MMVRGIGVMRRRSDSWLNATQLLKVAGIDKGRRTKILDKDIAAGNRIPFEKVQGGYGRYQGTWIPFHCGRNLAEQYGVLTLIQPLLDYQAAPPPPPLAGLGQGSPTTATVKLSTSDPTQSPHYQSQQQQQAAVANTQYQKSQQQAQLAQAQRNPLPSSSTTSTSTPRANGISASNAAVTSADPESSATSSQTIRKRLRQHANSTLKANPETDDLEIQEGSSNTKRPRTTQQPEPSTSNTTRLDSSQITTTAMRRTPSASSLRIRKATKYPPSASINLEHRNLLMSLFIPDPSAAPSGELDPAIAVASFPPHLDPDIPIDDQQHTALHWASALARIPVLRSLISLGSDPNRGNATGETPLMRAVLVTNNFDTETFTPPHLLSLLSPSLRTTDDAERTVLHHIALVAGIKGRSASARHYLETILHWIVDKENGHFGGLLDAQDGNGDTALNIAARVGSRPIVRMLIESGADPRIPNKLGLRPGDFGFLDEGLTLPTAEEIAVDQLRSSNPLNTSSSESGSLISYQQQSSNLLASFTTLLNTLSTDFASEISSRTDSLDRTRTALHLATKDLAEQRQIILGLREKVKQLELSKWRIRNLERALEDEDKFDWTGRSGIDGQPAFLPIEADAANGSRKERSSSPAAIQRGAFEYRGVNSTLGILQAINMPTTIAADPKDPASSNVDESKTTPSPPPSQLTLAQVRRMVLWYERVLDLLRERIQVVQGNSGEMELNARKVVKLCTGVESDREVEDMLANLITALESDGGESSMLDLQR